MDVAAVSHGAFGVDRSPPKATPPDCQRLLGRSPDQTKRSDELRSIEGGLGFIAMADTGAEQVRESVDAVYCAESRRILATLIRLLGDFDLAEDALHDAFTVALERWPKEGVPANPRAWLVSTGR